MNEESSIDIYKPCVKQTASGKLLYNTGSSAWCSGMGGVGGWGVREGGDVRVPIADSLQCTVETNTTLQSNYIPIKK